MKLDRKQIKELFVQTNQADVLVSLYKLVFPDWDSIKQISGYPKISKELWQYICQLFIDFDKKYHPTVMAGGCWMNTGFSSNELLTDDSVDLSGVTVQYFDGIEDIYY